MLRTRLQIKAVMMVNVDEVTSAYRAEVCDRESISLSAGQMPIARQRSVDPLMLIGMLDARGIRRKSDWSGESIKTRLCCR